jgi:hypothetical protein
MVINWLSEFYEYLAILIYDFFKRLSDKNDLYNS